MHFWQSFKSRLLPIYFSSLALIAHVSGHVHEEKKLDDPQGYGIGTKAPTGREVVTQKKGKGQAFVVCSHVDRAPYSSNISSPYVLPCVSGL